MDGQKFQAGAKALRNGPIFPDFIIACEGAEHKVHKAFVSCHSVYFHKLLKGGDFEEITAGKIELNEDSPKAVELMVDYFHSSDYSNDYVNYAGFSSILELNAAVYVVAEKYEVPELKTLAAKKFAIAARSSVTEKESPLGAIKLVFNRTPPTDTLLREICVQYWAIYGSMCLENDPKLHHKILEEVPDFAAALISHATLTTKVSFATNCAHWSSYKRSTSVGSASELWTTKCVMCGLLVGEHARLTISTLPTTVKPFWAKWSK